MEICYYHRERSHVPPGGKRGNHLQKSLGIGYDNSQEGNMIAFNFQRKHLVSWPQPSFRCCVLLNTQDVLNQFTIRFTNLSRYYNTSTIELMKCWRLRNLSFQFWSGLKTAVTYNTLIAKSQKTETVWNIQPVCTLWPHGQSTWLTVPKR